MVITKQPVVVPKTAFCFGCNQSFDGNPVGLQFDTDLVTPPHRAELRGLYFHPGHLYRYARHRDWAELAQFLQQNGPTNY
jgi:hypothetical protein